MSKKSVRAIIRLTEYEKNKLQKLADIYTGGNLSMWLRYAAFSAPRRMIKRIKESN